MVENSAAGLVMVDAEVAVTVTREERHQDVLARYAPAPGGERRVAVELTWCLVATGKYRGQRAIEVRLDGYRVGELTYLMSQRYAPLVNHVHARGGRPGCEAVVAREARGLQLTLHLPRDGGVVPVDAPTVVHAAVPAPAVPAASAESTFVRHRTAWGAAVAVAAVLVFVGVTSQDDDPVRSTAADEIATTTTFAVPTTTPPPPPTTTTPPPPPPTTTTVPPPPPEPTVEQAAPPPPVAEPEPAGQCDPNYSGCVPIASDVDCAGGSGNGPAYADGPVDVIGTDVYGLDRDGNGVACE